MGNLAHYHCSKFVIGQDNLAFVEGSVQPTEHMSGDIDDIVAGPPLCSTLPFCFGNNWYIWSDPETNLLSWAIGL